MLYTRKGHSWMLYTERFTTEYVTPERATAKCFTWLNALQREGHRWTLYTERFTGESLHRKGHSWMLYTERVTAEYFTLRWSQLEFYTEMVELSALNNQDHSWVLYIDRVIARYFTQTWSHLNTLHRDDHRWVFIQTVSNSWMCAHREWHSWILYALRVTQLNTLHTESNTAEYFTHRE